MSAVWMRAQEFGQPFTCRDSAAGRRTADFAAKRSSSSATAAMVVSLVSTIASLQNSMPVQAIAERRKMLGAVARPSASSSAAAAATDSAGMSSASSFWCGVVRSRREPWRSSRSAKSSSSVPESRPALGLAPMK